MLKSPDSNNRESAENKSSYSLKFRLALAFVLGLVVGGTVIKKCADQDFSGKDEITHVKQDPDKIWEQEKIREIMSKLHPIGHSGKSNKEKQDDELLNRVINLKIVQYFKEHEDSDEDIIKKSSEIYLDEKFFVAKFIIDSCGISEREDRLSVIKAVLQGYILKDAKKLRRDEKGWYIKLVKMNDKDDTLYVRLKGQSSECDFDEKKLNAKLILEADMLLVDSIMKNMGDPLREEYVNFKGGMDDRPEKVIKKALSRINVDSWIHRKKRLELLNRSHENIKPLLSVLPNEQRQILKDYDKDKYKLIGKVILGTGIDRMPLGLYHGKVNIDENGNLAEDDNGQYFLIFLGSDFSPDDPGFLGIIVHEVYGHAFDDDSGKLKEMSKTIKDAFTNSIELCEGLKSIFKSEIRSYYLQAHFLDWMFRNNVPLGKQVRVISKNIRVRSGSIAGSAEMENYNYYKEAEETKDWTEFKLRILKISLKDSSLTCLLLSKSLNLKDLIRLQNFMITMSDSHDYEDDELDELLKKLFVDMISPEKP